MLRAQILRQLKSSGSPVAWLSVARACGIVRFGGIGRRRWTARMAYALRRADRPDEATSAYVAAITDRRGDQHLAELISRIRADNDAQTGQAGQAGSGGTVVAQPGWFYNLGLCLRKRGDLEGAAQLLRAACRLEPNKAGWFSALAQVHESAGDLAAAVAAQERTVALRGDADPRARLRLASLHDQAGHWSVAEQLLIENLRLHAGHPESLRLLAEVVSTAHLWGGTFIDTLSGAGRRFVSTPADQQPAGSAAAGQGPVARARSALEQALTVVSSKPAWRVELAETLLADGDHRGAIEQFDLALQAARHSDGRWALGAKQRWQFRLEHTYHLIGDRRVDDPLFECEAQPVGPATTGTVELAGLFRARLSHVGFVISGLVSPAEGDHVDFLLDGVLLRSLNLGQEGHFRRFSFKLKRRTVALLPAESYLEVRTARGTPLRAPGGTERVRLTVPHGDGRLPEILAAGGTVDKKGMLSPSKDETRQRQQRYLEIYSRVRDFFESHLGRSVFLMYGTLLGYYRDGDFIPGDDDFDAGYVSDRTDPIAVKEETKGIIVELVRAGFTVSFNRRGRLFRVQLERGATDGYHVDLRPLWFEGGNVWVHNHVCLPSSRDEFLPVVNGTLRGVPVSVPRNTEAFLRGHYGPGWKVPDPGFTYYASEVDPKVRQNLTRALITVPEYKQLADRVQREVAASPEAGRFVSIGSQDLYPLEDFIS